MAFQSPVRPMQSPIGAMSAPAPSASSLCSVDGRDFKHPNILAHHIKEHSGPKCNICGKTFKHRPSLRKHLRRHRPQAGPGAGPPAAQGGPPAAQGEPPAAGPPATRAASRAGAAPSAEAGPPPLELRCAVCNKKMKHKRNLTRHMKSHKTKFQIKATKWETL
jgi:uncharacterized Zn-finger protein